MATARNVVIMGAARRDFHNLNVLFCGNPAYRVVAFTATQIPNIEGRLYPADLVGDGYSNGVPIAPEEDPLSLIREHAVDNVVFAYSNVAHDYVMHRAVIAQAVGASFWLLGPNDVMLKSSSN